MDVVFGACLHRCWTPKWDPLVKSCNTILFGPIPTPLRVRHRWLCWFWHGTIEKKNLNRDKFTQFLSAFWTCIVGFPHLWAMVYEKYDFEANFSYKWTKLGSLVVYCHFASRMVYHRSFWNRGGGEPVFLFWGKNWQFPYSWLCQRNIQIVVM